MFQFPWWYWCHPRPSAGSYSYLAQQSCCVARFLEHGIEAAYSPKIDTLPPSFLSLRATDINPQPLEKRHRLELQKLVDTHNQAGNWAAGQGPDAAGLLVSVHDDSVILRNFLCCLEDVVRQVRKYRQTAVAPMGRGDQRSRTGLRWSPSLCSSPPSFSFWFCFVVAFLVPVCCCSFAVWWSNSGPGVLPVLLTTRNRRNVGDHHEDTREALAVSRLVPRLLCRAERVCLSRRRRSCLPCLLGG